MASNSKDTNQHDRKILEFSLGATADSSRQTVAFWAHLSEEEREALVSGSRHEQYTSGSVICREGEPGNALYIIKSGRVAVLKEIGDGRTTVLGYRGAGEIVGEMSLVAQQPRSASLVAAEDTELLCVEGVDFPALMDEHPNISGAILKVLSNRIQAADKARTTILHEEQDLNRRLRRVTGEAARLAELARVRQDAIEIIAHDLRTPLAVIDGCLQMLSATLPTDTLGTSASFLDLAQRSSMRLTSLVEELLSAARQEASAAALVKEPVDLGSVLQTAVESAQITALRSGLDLDLQVSPNIPHVLGDAAQLERVAGNLLDNAIAYTPSGGHIQVSIVEREGKIEVCVSDTGPGVPAEYREVIFERFARVPGTERRKEGFGLGLYFCRQAIEAQGGQIWVEPGPGNIGSRFVFTLPAQEKVVHV
jgi:signal transduction histidine kinase